MQKLRKNNGLEFGPIIVECYNKSALALEKHTRLHAKCNKSALALEKRANLYAKSKYIQHHLILEEAESRKV